MVGGSNPSGATTFLLRSLQAPRPNWAGFDLASPLIMGVVNVTPDSFSDGGDFATAEDATAQGLRLAEQGADIIDIGGESTRPGAQEVSAEEEIRRVVPVVRSLAERGLCVSIDTRHAGGHGRRGPPPAPAIINDITALTGDPESPRSPLKSGAAIVLMHMQGEPRTMQADPSYADTTLDLIDYFSDRLADLAKLASIPPASPWIPASASARRTRTTCCCSQELAAFHVFGCAVLLGVSRKSFVGRLSRKEPPKDRLAARSRPASPASTRACRSSASTTSPKPTRPAPSGWPWAIDWIKPWRSRSHPLTASAPPHALAGGRGLG